MEAGLAHLVIRHSDAESVALTRGGLPSVPAGRLFEAAELLGVDAAIVVVRPLTRLGDDRVVACEFLGSPGTLPGDLRWESIDDAAQIANFGPVIAEWADEEAGVVTHARAAWHRHGWIARALAWASGVATEGGRRIVGPPVQLRHWGESAVFRVPTDAGRDIVIKEVPRALRAEGPLTAWLAKRCPNAVPAVLGVDEQTGRFAMDAFDTGGPVGPQGVVALADVQQAVGDRVDELLALGLPDLRLPRLIEAAARLTERADLLLCDSWSLASTDTRRPPRPMTSDDIEELRTLVPDLIGRGERVAALLPDGRLVHGDFHTQNIVAAAGSMRIFDWAHAAVAMPGLDLPAWPNWADRSEVGVRPYLQRWMPADRVASLWADLETIALLFHAIVAARLSDAVDDPSSRPDWAAGVQKLVLRTLSAARG